MPQTNPCKIFVGNLAREVREKDVQRLFEEAGQIRLIEFKHGFAFVVRFDFFFDNLLKNASTRNMNVHVKQKKPFGKTFLASAYQIFFFSFHDDFIIN